MKCIEAGLFGGQKSGSSTGLLYYCTFGLEAANNAQKVRIDTAHGKVNDQQNLSKCDIAVYISKSLQMSEDTIILFISS